MMLNISDEYDYVCKYYFFHNLHKQQISLKMIWFIVLFFKYKTKTIKIKERIEEYFSIQYWVPVKLPLLSIVVLIYNVNLLDIC